MFKPSYEKVGQFLKTAAIGFWFVVAGAAILITIIVIIASQGVKS